MKTVLEILIKADVERRNRFIGGTHYFYRTGSADLLDPQMHRRS